MKKVFISHPFASDPEGNREKEKKICTYLLRKGYLPISPLHLFSYVDKETHEIRGEIMKICFNLIDLADEVFMFGDSEGCKEEELYALSKGKKIVKFYPEFEYQIVEPVENV